MYKGGLVSIECLGTVKREGTSLLGPAGLGLLRVWKGQARKINQTEQDQPTSRQAVAHLTEDTSKLVVS